MTLEQRKEDRVSGVCENASFQQKHLSAQQRQKMGIDAYYRPFRVDRAEMARERYTYRLIKRILDIVLSCLVLAVVWPVLLIFMIAVVVEDPKASPIFKQIRVGQNGKTFVMYKLRSMYANAEAQFEELVDQNEAQTKAFKMKNDPRITKVGRIARRFSVDELFQFVNVLLADMSIVGPRPPLTREVEQYDEYDLQRLMVRPGLTCYWQVCPNRHEISFEDWVALDLKYLVSRSIGVDLLLMVKTLFVVFAGKGD